MFLHATGPCYRGHEQPLVAGIFQLSENRSPNTVIEASAPASLVPKAQLSAPICPAFAYGGSRAIRYFP